MPIDVPRYLHLDLSKHVMRNISRFRLRAHTLKVEAAAWLEDGSRVCDQCPGEDEHVQNEVHALLSCQDHRVCELRKHFPSCLHLSLRIYWAAKPYLLQPVNNQLVYDFLSQQSNILFLFLWAYVFICGWPRPVSSRSAKLPGWRSSPIVTIVTIVTVEVGVQLCPHFPWVKMRNTSNIMILRCQFAHMCGC